MECKFKNNRMCSLTSCTSTQCLLDQEYTKDKCVIFNTWNELYETKKVLSSVSSELRDSEMDKAEIINLLFSTDLDVFLTKDGGQWYVNIDIGQGQVEKWKIREEDVRNGIYDSIPHR